MTTSRGATTNREISPAVPPATTTWSREPCAVGRVELLVTMDGWSGRYVCTTRLRVKGGGKKGREIDGGEGGHMLRMYVVTPAPDARQHMLGIYFTYLILKALAVLRHASEKKS